MFRFCDALAAVDDRGPGLALSEAALQSALEKLAEADILLVEGLPPEADYRFKHALIQDAAYENLLKSRRQALHRRAAETLRDPFPDRAEAEPEALAHHFTQAGLTEAAIEYWGKAGDQALRRSAFQEAISHLGKAIADGGQGGECVRVSERRARTRAGQRLQLQTSYGKALMLSQGYASEEAKAAFAHARELAKGVDNAAERFDAYYGQCAGSLLRGELRLAREIAENFLCDTEREARTTEAAAARRCLGAACLWQGDLAAARAHFEQALRIFDPQRDREAKFRFGHDTGVAATLQLALTNWLLGKAGPARRLIEAAIARALESAMRQPWPDALAKSLFRCGSRRCRSRPASRRYSVLEVSREHGLGLFLAVGALASGWGALGSATARPA